MRNIEIIFIKENRKKISNDEQNSVQFHWIYEKCGKIYAKLLNGGNFVGKMCLARDD